MHSTRLVSDSPSRFGTPPDARAKSKSQFHSSTVRLRNRGPNGDGQTGPAKRGQAGRFLLEEPGSFWRLVHRGLPCSHDRRRHTASCYAHAPRSTSSIQSLEQKPPETPRLSPVSSGLPGLPPVSGFLSKIAQFRLPPFPPISPTSDVTSWPTVAERLARLRPASYRRQDVGLQVGEEFSRLLKQRCECSAGVLLL